MCMHAYTLDIDISIAIDIDRSIELLAGRPGPPDVRPDRSTPGGGRPTAHSTHATRACMPLSNIYAILFIKKNKLAS